jgi:hypothetical protein
MSLISSFEIPDIEVEVRKVLVFDNSARNLGPQTIENRIASYPSFWALLVTISVEYDELFNRLHKEVIQHMVDDNRVANFLFSKVPPGLSYPQVIRLLKCLEIAQQKRIADGSVSLFTKTLLDWLAIVGDTFEASGVQDLLDVWSILFRFVRDEQFVDSKDKINWLSRYENFTERM